MISAAAASTSSTVSAPVMGRVPPPSPVAAATCDVGVAATVVVGAGLVVVVVVGGTTARASVSTHAPELYESQPYEPQAGAAVPVVCHTSSWPSRRCWATSSLPSPSQSPDPGRADRPAAGQLGPARRLGALGVDRVEGVEAVAGDHLVVTVAVEIGDGRRDEQAEVGGGVRRAGQLVAGLAVPRRELVVVGQLEVGRQQVDEAGQPGRVGGDLLAAAALQLARWSDRTAR